MYKLSTAQVNCQKALDSCDNCLVLKSIRSGKTLCMLDYAKSKGYNKILWVVPYTINIDGVFEEIKKWNIELNIDIICYNSLHKYVNEEFDLIILDEVHRITNKHKILLSKILYNKCIGMTGTLPKSYDKKYILYNILNMNLVFEYTVADAIKDGSVAPYSIEIIKKKLDTQRNYKIVYQDKKDKTTKFFYTSELQRYNYLSSKADESFYANLNRLRFINTLPSTIEFIKNYIIKNKDKRFLIFVSTKDMAEQCSKYCYYGGKENTYFDLFQKGKINHLVLVQKATIGITYENLDQVLLTNINSSNSSVQQKIFRAILFRPNYKAKIDILINEKTIQEKYITKALEDL
jgi:superfamily II DNA or RNA helicase